jgi:hypothetical protein
MNNFEHQRPIILGNISNQYPGISCWQMNQSGYDLNSSGLHRTDQKLDASSYIANSGFKASYATTPLLAEEKENQHYRGSSVLKALNSDQSPSKSVTKRSLTLASHNQRIPSPFSAFDGPTNAAPLHHIRISRDEFKSQVRLAQFGPNHLFFKFKVYPTKIERCQIDENGNEVVGGICEIIQGVDKRESIKAMRLADYANQQISRPQQSKPCAIQVQNLKPNNQDTFNSYVPMLDSSSFTVPPQEVSGAEKKREGGNGTAGVSADFNDWIEKGIFKQILEEKTKKYTNGHQQLSLINEEMDERSDYSPIKPSLMKDRSHLAMRDDQMYSMITNYNSGGKSRNGRPAPRQECVSIVEAMRPKMSDSFMTIENKDIKESMVTPVPIYSSDFTGEKSGNLDSLQPLKVIGSAIINANYLGGNQRHSNYELNEIREEDIEEERTLRDRVVKEVTPRMSTDYNPQYVSSGNGTGFALDGLDSRGEDRGYDNLAHLNHNFMFPSIRESVSRPDRNLSVRASLNFDGNQQAAAEGDNFIYLDQTRHESDPYKAYLVENMAQPAMNFCPENSEVAGETKGVTPFMASQLVNEILKSKDFGTNIGEGHQPFIVTVIQEPHSKDFLINVEVDGSEGQIQNMRMSQDDLLNINERRNLEFDDDHQLHCEDSETAGLDGQLNFRKKDKHLSPGDTDSAPNFEKLEYPSAEVNKDSQDNEDSDDQVMIDNPILKPFGAEYRQNSEHLKEQESPEQAEARKNKMEFSNPVKLDQIVERSQEDSEHQTDTIRNLMRVGDSQTISETGFVTQKEQRLGSDQRNDFKHMNVGTDFAHSTAKKQESKQAGDEQGKGDFTSTFAEFLIKQDELVKSSLRESKTKDLSSALNSVNISGKKGVSNKKDRASVHTSEPTKDLQSPPNIYETNREQLEARQEKSEKVEENFEKASEEIEKKKRKKSKSKSKTKKVKTEKGTSPSVQEEGPITAVLKNSITKPNEVIKATKTDKATETEEDSKSLIRFENHSHVEQSVQTMEPTPKTSTRNSRTPTPLKKTSTRTDKSKSVTRIRKELEPSQQDCKSSMKDSHTTYSRPVSPMTYRTEKRATTPIRNQPESKHHQKYSPFNARVPTPTKISVNTKNQPRRSKSPITSNNQKAVIKTLFEDQIGSSQMRKNQPVFNPNKQSDSNKWKVDKVHLVDSMVSGPKHLYDVDSLSHVTGQLPESKELSFNNKSDYSKGHSYQANRKGSNLSHIPPAQEVKTHRSTKSNNTAQNQQVYQVPRANFEKNSKISSNSSQQQGHHHSNPKNSKQASKGKSYQVQPAAKRLVSNDIPYHQRMGKNSNQLRNSKQNLKNRCSEIRASEERYNSRLNQHQQEQKDTEEEDFLRDTILNEFITSLCTTGILKEEDCANENFFIQNEAIMISFEDMINICFEMGFLPNSFDIENPEFARYRLA